MNSESELYEWVEWPTSGIWRHTCRKGLPNSLAPPRIFEKSRKYPWLLRAFGVCPEALPPFKLLFSFPADCLTFPSQYRREPYRLAFFHLRLPLPQYIHPTSVLWSLVLPVYPCAHYRAPQQDQWSMFPSSCHQHRVTSTLILPAHGYSTQTFRKDGPT